MPEGDLFQTYRPLGLTALNLPAILQQRTGDLVSTESEGTKRDSERRPNVTYYELQHPIDECLAHHIEDIDLGEGRLSGSDMCRQVDVARPRVVSRPLQRQLCMSGSQVRRSRTRYSHDSETAAVPRLRTAHPSPRADRRSRETSCPSRLVWPIRPARCLGSHESGSRFGWRYTRLGREGAPRHAG